jgi:hypothetical protein
MSGICGGCGRPLPGDTGTYCPVCGESREPNAAPFGHPDHDELAEERRLAGVFPDYAEACRRAAIDQGLGAFLDADGWSVEQTGGFTMVAYRRMEGRREVWSVTHEDGYLACLWTAEEDETGEEPDGEPYLTGLTQEQALALDDRAAMEMRESGTVRFSS